MSGWRDAPKDAEYTTAIVDGRPLEVIVSRKVPPGVMYFVDRNTVRKFIITERKPRMKLREWMYWLGVAVLVILLFTLLGCGDERPNQPDVAGVAVERIIPGGWNVRAVYRMDDARTGVTCYAHTHGISCLKVR